MIYKEENMEENFMTFAENINILKAYAAAKGPPDCERGEIAGPVPTLPSGPVSLPWVKTLEG